MLGFVSEFEAKSALARLMAIGESMFYVSRVAPLECVSTLFVSTEGWPTSCRRTGLRLAGRLLRADVAAQLYLIWPNGFVEWFDLPS